MSLGGGNIVIRDFSCNWEFRGLRGKIGYTGFQANSGTRGIGGNGQRLYGSTRLTSAARLSGEFHTGSSVGRTSEAVSGTPQERWELCVVQ